ncbi:MAG TPA: ATP-binding cassette domain-containing protein [Arenimonas sp.]|nr:ATP-binding cassette domain-containing protein [Arenimonas sp.]
MPLLSLNQVDFSVGGPLLLQSVNLSLEQGERIALIGRNGAGKSTLLRLIEGVILPDDGQIVRQDGLRIARLEQEVPNDLHGDIFDVVATGLGELGEDLALYHHLSHSEPFDADAFAEVQGRIEASGAWNLEQKVSETLERMQLDESLDFASLSGGMKRRVLLARALVASPDVLLLDEPTNHLDIEAIDWLETTLKQWPGCLVFITHDRRFLKNLATRIVEIDRGSVTSWPGDWSNYQRRLTERQNDEAVNNARFDKFLAQEEVWIRQGIKARRVRDEGRVRRLEAMRNERVQRREKTGNVNMQASQAESSGKRVFDVKDVSFGFGGKTLVKDFSTRIQRGDRVALIGPNGSGKSTLIKLLLGQLTPQSGEVVPGARLEVAYFDQYRNTLRDDWNALDNVSEGMEFIEINGSRKHVLGYLQDFLFTPDRARAPITRLSGGERNRLLLAKLFAQPSNLLVMDEPTNDLDVETLELLEELLDSYQGTLLLVSHDRDFIDSVATSCMVMAGDGVIEEYVGGYSDYLRQRRPSLPAAAVQASKTSPSKAPVPAETKKKLSYKDARELEQLPLKIEQLETQLAGFSSQMQQADFYQQSADKITAHTKRMESAQAELDAAYARWAVLDA